MSPHFRGCYKGGGRLAKPKVGEEGVTDYLLHKGSWAATAGGRSGGVVVTEYPGINAFFDQVEVVILGDGG